MEFYNIISQNFLNNHNIKHYSRNKVLGAVFAERFNRTIRDLLKRPTFEKGESNWIDLLSVITKQYNNRRHSSTKLTPIEASLKRNEGYVHHNLLDKRKKIKANFQVNDLVRVEDLKKTFSKGDTNKWFYELYKKLKLLMIQYRVIALTIYQKDNEVLMKKTNLTLKENDCVMRKKY